MTPFSHGGIDATLRRFDVFHSFDNIAFLFLTPCHVCMRRKTFAEASKANLAERDNCLGVSVTKGVLNVCNCLILHEGGKKDCD